MMFDQKTRYESEALRRNAEVEIVAKSLPGFRVEIAAIRLCRAEQTEFHRALLPNAKSQNRGSSGNATRPACTCTRASSAQRCSVGNTLPGLSKLFSSNAHLSRCC